MILRYRFQHYKHHPMCKMCCELFVLAMIATFNYSVFRLFCCDNETNRQYIILWITGENYSSIITCRHKSENKCQFTLTFMRQFICVYLCLYLYICTRYLYICVCVCACVHSTPDNYDPRNYKHCYLSSTTEHAIAAVELICDMHWIQMNWTPFNVIFPEQK